MPEHFDWYDFSPLPNEWMIISSRVRFARNIAKYPFVNKQTDETANAVITDVSQAIKHEGGRFSKYIDIKTLSNVDRLGMLYRHIISPGLANPKGPAGLWLSDDNVLGVMINEEDHIRIQAICPGNDINKAWELVNETDDFLEQAIDYAYDDKLGFLTSCPTNTGTGLRASYMVHLPLLERSKDFDSMTKALTLTGFTARGLYGEGSNSAGSIYQISNQVTIGKSEKEIIEGLSSTVLKIISVEKSIYDIMPKKERIDTTDRVFRAYAILRSCRKISSREAINLLSDVRLGLTTGILTGKAPVPDTYTVMMNTQDAIIYQKAGRFMSPEETDVARADYIRGTFADAQEKL